MEQGVGSLLSLFCSAVLAEPLYRHKIGRLVLLCRFALDILCEKGD